MQNHDFCHSSKSKFDTALHAELPLRCFVFTPPKCLEEIITVAWQAAGLAVVGNIPEHPNFWSIVKNTWRLQVFYDIGWLSLKLSFVTIFPKRNSFEAKNVSICCTGSLKICRYRLLRVINKNAKTNVYIYILCTQKKRNRLRDFWKLERASGPSTCRLSFWSWVFNRTDIGWHRCSLNPSNLTTYLHWWSSCRKYKWGEDAGWPSCMTEVEPSVIVRINTRATRPQGAAPCFRRSSHMAMGQY